MKLVSNWLCRCSNLTYYYRSTTSVLIIPIGILMSEIQIFNNSDSIGHPCKQPISLLHNQCKVQQTLTKTNQQHIVTSTKIQMQIISSGLSPVPGQKYSMFEIGSEFLQLFLVKYYSWCTIYACWFIYADFYQFFL